MILMSGMYPRLFKRGPSWYVELSRGEKKSLGVTDEREAKKLVKAIQKADLEKKLAFLDKKDRLSISEFIPLWVNNPDRKELSWKTLQGDNLAFNLLKDALGDIPLKLIDKEAIRKFKTVSIARVKPTSVNSYLRHIKSGLNWAKKEEYIDKVPDIQMYKSGSKITRYLSKNEIKSILEYSGKHNPEMNRIINFALYTGCRREEIIRARYEHIQGDKIKINGKGNKERLIPLLSQALPCRKDIGKIFQYTHVSTVSNYFRKIARACGIKSRFHDLRHTAGTQMLSAGIDLKTVKEILGHTDIRTTEIYAQVLAETMSKEMQKLNYD
jgi:integrase